MSALTDLFTAMANKIRSKTGTATTYTPSEMASDGIDDVYDAGVASATTSITPSNASPVAMSANTGYKPTANGYAISSYSSVTPSSTQTAVSSGDIVKIGGSGVIVDSVPTPTSITPSNANPKELIADRVVKPTINGFAIEEYLNILPSNSSPATLSTAYLYKPGASGYAIESYSSVTPSNASPVDLTSGSIYKMNGNGKAIASYSSITPSNSSPVTLSSGEIYKMGGAGKAVASVTSKTPSDSSPASVTANSIIQPSAAGYLVSSNPNDNVPTLIGTQTVASTSNVTMTLTDNLSNYRYIYVTQSGNFNGNYDSTDSRYAKSLIKVSYLKNNTVTCYFLSGQDGSMTQKTVTVTYSTDTKLIFKANSSVSRTIGVYGIK